MSKQSAENKARVAQVNEWSQSDPECLRLMGEITQAKTEMAATYAAWQDRLRHLNVKQGALMKRRMARLREIKAEESA